MCCLCALCVICVHFISSGLWICGASLKVEHHSFEWLFYCPRITDARAGSFEHFRSAFHAAVTCRLSAEIIIVLAYASFLSGERTQQHFEIYFGNFVIFLLLFIQTSISEANDLFYGNFVVFGMRWGGSKMAFTIIPELRQIFSALWYYLAIRRYLTFSSIFSTGLRDFQWSRQCSHEFGCAPAVCENHFILTFS